MTKSCLLAARSFLNEKTLEQLENLVTEEMKWRIVTAIDEKPDIILYGPGGEISPELYHPKTKPKGTVNLLRDGEEVFLYYWSQFVATHPVWNIGFDRGLHLLNAVNGGKPRVRNKDPNFNKATHPLSYITPGRKSTIVHSVTADHEFTVSPPMNGKEKHNPFTVLATSYKAGIEAILFPKTNSLGLQFRPDQDNQGSLTCFKDILTDYVFPIKQQEEAA